MHQNIIPGAVQDEFLDLWIYSSARDLPVFHENVADTILVSRLSLISTCNRAYVSSVTPIWFYTYLFVVGFFNASPFGSQKKRKIKFSE